MIFRHLTMTILRQLTTRRHKDNPTHSSTIMRIAIIQSANDIENGRIERQRAEELISQHSKPGDLWILPEAYDTGWNIKADDVQLPEPANNEFFTRLSAKHHIAICGSYYEKLPEGGYSNTFRVVSADSGLNDACAKRHLFGNFEKSSVKPGNTMLTFTIGEFRLRAVICYDLRFPVWCRNIKDSPYDALLCVSQWPMSRAGDRNLMLAARSMENVAYAISANALGGSAVYQADGTRDFLMEAGQEIGFYNLDSNILANFRRHKKYLMDADYFELRM